MLQELVKEDLAVLFNDRTVCLTRLFFPCPIHSSLSSVCIRSDFGPYTQATATAGSYNPNK
jgi:hypothetical protein